MPVREVVKQLEGRERELITEAAAEVQKATVRIAQVIARGRQAEKHYTALLEVATGEDPQDLLLDSESGQVFREASE